MLIQDILFYVKSFRNFPMALIRRMIHSYPIEVYLRKHDITVSVENDNQFYMAGYFGNFLPQTSTNFEINYLQAIKAFLIKGKADRSVIFKHAFDDGDFPGVFLAEEYADISVLDKTVIDIGASIGDSALYFYIQGAKKIYGYEPTKRAFDFAMDNVITNNLFDSIELVNAAVSNRTSIILVEDRRKITGGSQLKENTHGREVELYSFVDIVKRTDGENLVLKMDCEGCEYDIFASLNAEVLRKFEKVVLEYHHGPEKIDEFLRDAGYKSKLIRKSNDVGIIIAKRI